MAELLNPGTVLVYQLLTLFFIYFIGSTFLIPLNVSALVLCRFLARWHSIYYSLTANTPFMEFTVATLEISLAWRMVLELYDMGMKRRLKQSRYSREQRKGQPILLGAWYTFWIAAIGSNAFVLIEAILDKVAKHNAIYDERITTPEFIARMVTLYMHLADVIVNA